MLSSTEFTPQQLNDILRLSAAKNHAAFRELQIAAVPCEPTTPKQQMIREMQSMKERIEQHFNTAIAFIQCSED